MTTYPSWLTAAISGDRDIMRKDFPWAQIMADCPQDSLYHAEGDVWTHTMMVMDGAERRGAELPEGDALEIMRLAALFHDSAKPEVTKIEWCDTEKRERVKQPGHAAKGGDKAWQKLVDAGYPIAKTRDIVGLCQWHQRPSHIPDQANKQGRIARYSAEGGRWDRLLALCESDQQGRFSPNVEEGMISLGLLRIDIEELSENLGFDLISGETPDNADWRVRAGESFEASPFNLPFADPDRQVLTVLSGLPGSGKSTYARKLSEETGAHVINLDNIRQSMDGYKRNDEFEGRCIQIAMKALRRELAAKRPVIWDATNFDQKSRMRVLSIGRSYGSLTKLVSFDLPKDVAFDRNSQREEPVPQKIMEIMAAKREMPLATEAHHVYSAGNGEMIEVSRRPRKDVENAPAI